MALDWEREQGWHLACTLHSPAVRRWAAGEVVFCGKNEGLLSAGRGLGEIKFRLENASYLHPVNILLAGVFSFKRIN